MKLTALLLIISLTATNSALFADTQSHGDHSSKNSGQFFMAPDGYHHLEGTMPNSREFRLYFYDDTTRPLRATPYVTATTIDVDRMNGGQEVGQPMRINVQVEPGGKYLVAKIPSEIKLPLYYSVNIKFKKRKQPDLFNFIFTDLPKKATD